MYEVNTLAALDLWELNLALTSFREPELFASEILMGRSQFPSHLEDEHRFQLRIRNVID